MLIKELENYIARNRARGVSTWSALFSIPKKYYQYGFQPHPKNQIYGYGLYDKPLLISYSRSGTNWMRYIIEFLSGKSTPGYARLVNDGNYIIDRAHKGFFVIRKYSKVILLLRNYKECLIRHSLSRWESSSSVKEFLEDNTLGQPPSWYIKNIRAFDNFKQEKLLVYYEDLVSESVFEAERIANFLDIRNAAITDFKVNLNFHQQRSINYYSENQKSLTRGDSNNLKYHSQKNLTPAQKFGFDIYYETNYPDLYQKYLSRYRD